jgi:hypothetical protein
MMINNQTRRDMLERNYAKAYNALQILIEEEGACNALNSYCDALAEIKPISSLHESNIFYVNQVVDIISAIVDINLEEATKKVKLDKLQEAIIFLTEMRNNYEA